MVIIMITITPYIIAVNPRSLLLFSLLADLSFPFAGSWFIELWFSFDQFGGEKLRDACPVPPFLSSFDLPLTSASPCGAVILLFVGEDKHDVALSIQQ